MVTKVKIYNDNIYPLKEIFKGEEVEIAANDYWRDSSGEHKVVDIFEANEFRGQYRPVPFDGSGKMINDPKYWKKIKMEPVGDNVPIAEMALSARCMAPGCKHVSASPEELETHTRIKHETAERLVLPEQDAVIEGKKVKK